LPLVTRSHGCRRLQLRMVAEYGALRESNESSQSLSVLLKKGRHMPSLVLPTYYVLPELSTPCSTIGKSCGNDIRSRWRSTSTVELSCHNEGREERSWSASSGKPQERAKSLRFFGVFQGLQFFGDPQTRKPYYRTEASESR